MLSYILLNNEENLWKKYVGIMESCYMKNLNGIKLCKRLKIFSGFIKCSIYNCFLLEVYFVVFLKNNKN